jgi:hypothetical protein
MRAALALLAIAAPACVDDAWNDPVRVDEVITGLSIRAPTTPALADGATPLTIELDVAVGDGLDPNLDLVLETSAGRWVLSDAGAPAKKTIKVKQQHTTIELLPPTAAGTVVVSATLKGYSRTAELALAPVGIADVFRRFEVTPPVGGAVADDATPVAVTVCATERQAAIAMTRVDLRTSEGRWSLGNSTDPTQVSSGLGADGCAAATLYPSVRPTTIGIAATIAGLTETRTLVVRPAEIAMLECRVTGSVAASTGAGALVVWARATSINGGKPSIGTRVRFSADVSPATAAGYFETPIATLATGVEISSTFSAFGHPTQIVFNAAALRDDGADGATCAVALLAP